MSPLRISSIISITIFLLLASIGISTGKVKTVLRVGYSDGFPLYQYTDTESGEAAGFHVDIIREIADKSDYPLEFTAYPSVNECIEDLRAGLIDVALGVNADLIADGDITVAGSLSTPSLCLISTNRVAELIREQKSTYGFPGVMEYSHVSKILSLRRSQNPNGFGSNTFFTVLTQDEVMDTLISGKAEIAVAVKESGEWYLDKAGISNGYTIIYNYLTKINYVMAVKSSDHRLARVLDSGLSDIHASGKYDELFTKWLETNDMILSRNTVRRILIVSMILISGIIIFFVFSWRVQHYLRRKVAEQTQELVKSNYSLTESLSRLQTETDIRRRIIEDSPSAMIIIDPNGEKTVMNSKAQKLAEISSEDGQNGSLLNMIIEQSEQKDSEEPFIVEYYNNRNKLTYRCNIYKLPSEGMESQRLLSIEDVTEESRKRQELFEKEKSRTINVIIAGIAHEVKNPLTAIRAYTQLIPTHKNNEEFLESFSTFVPSEVERINRLVNTLVNYASPAKEIRSRIELRDLLENCIGLVESLAKKVNAVITFECESSPCIFGYIDLLRQALVNYMLNAIDSVSTKDKGEISVKLSEKDKVAEIMIRDNGVGMSDHELRQCGEPFYTTKENGTGLGMAIAEQSIRENNGRIRIESQKGIYTAIYIDFEECL